MVNKKLPFIITEIFIDLLMCASMVGGPRIRLEEWGIWIKRARDGRHGCDGGGVGIELNVYKSESC